MTLPFWTPEKKEDYLNLLKKREDKRKYLRDYMAKARRDGRYKFVREGGHIKFLNLKPINYYYDKDTKGKTD